MKKSFIFVSALLMFSCATTKGKSEPEKDKAKKEIIEGALSKTEIEEEIRRNLRFIKQCYEDELKEADKNSAFFKATTLRIMTDFSINSDGKVTSSEAILDPGQVNPLKGTQEIKNLEFCIADVILNYKFQKPRGGGIVTVKYPFVFSSQK